MIVKTGDEVFLAFAIASDAGGRPYASVQKAVCIDGENAVYKRDDVGVVVLSRWSIETPCPSAAAAWRHCADVLRSRAGGIELAAEECMRKAGSALAEGGEATVCSGAVRG